MQALEFINSISQLQEKNLFLLYGEEHYLIDQCKEALLKAFAIPFPEMNLAVLKENVIFAEVKNACLQAPCFADYRAVILEDVDVSEKTFSFEKILEVLPEQTKLVLYYSKKPDMRKAVYKEIKKKAVCAEGDSLKEDALLKWLISSAKKEGIRLVKPVAELLIEICGSEMYALKNELEKLKYAQIFQPTEEDLRKIVAGSREYDIFNFHNAMMAENYSEAFNVFEKLRRDRSALMGFIGLLVSKFSPMYMARQCADAGMNDRQIAERLSEATGIKHYPAVFAARDCRDFQLEQIRRALQELEQADRALKTGGKLPEYKLMFLKIYGKV